MKANPTAAITIIGNEILSGRTQDANIQFIAERLTIRGINLMEVRVVRDEEKAIIQNVKDLSEKYDYVFTTGGIGPTHDDITAECIANAFNTPLEIHLEAKKRIEDSYIEKGREITAGSLRMARIPFGASLIDNTISVAPGFNIENVYVMAGVPEIMQNMFLSVEKSLTEGKPMLSNTVSCSLRESDVAIDLEKIQDEYPNVEIGSYPTSTSEGPSLSLVLRTSNEEELKTATEKTVEMVKTFDNQDPIVTYQKPPVLKD